MLQNESHEKRCMSQYPCADTPIFVNSVASPPTPDLQCPIGWSNWLCDAHIVLSHFVSSGSSCVALRQGEGDVVFRLGRREFGGSVG